MKIKFISPKLAEGNIKCTVHVTGKLGFSKQAIKQLNINSSSYVKIGINEDDKNDANLYMIIQKEKDNDTFKINKAGDYYYVNTRYLFDDLKIDYIRNKIIYDIQEIEISGMKIYKLNMRMLNRKKSK